MNRRIPFIPAVKEDPRSAEHVAAWKTLSEEERRKVLIGIEVEDAEKRMFPRLKRKKRRTKAEQAIVDKYTYRGVEPI